MTRRLCIALVSVLGLGLALAAPSACSLVTELQVGNSFETRVTKGVSTAPKAAVPTTVCTFNKGSTAFVNLTVATHKADSGAEAAIKVAQKNPAAIALDDLYGLTVFIPSNRPGHSLLITQFQRYYFRLEVASTDEKAYTQAKAVLRTAIKNLSSIINPRKPAAENQRKSPRSDYARKPRSGGPSR